MTLYRLPLSIFLILLTIGISVFPEPSILTTRYSNCFSRPKVNIFSDIFHKFSPPIF